METIFELFNFGSDHFAPHGYCFLWSPTLLWGMVIGDLLIVASYYTIPIALITFFSKRGAGKYHSLLWKFGAFILLCGTTHIIYLWNIWNSAYYLEMVVKLATGLVSIYVAYYVWIILPEALKIPSVSQLEDLNKSLAESELRYRKIFETSNEGVLLLDGQGKIEIANNAIAEMLGCNQEEIQEKNILEFFPANERSQFEGFLERRQQDEKFKHERSFLRKDGKIIHTLISSSPNHEDGKVIGSLNMIADVTDKVSLVSQLETLNRKLEDRVKERTDELSSLNQQLTKHIEEREQHFQELKDAKVRLDTVFNASPNGIVITNKQGMITDVNVSAESMFGYLKSQLIAQHVNILTPMEFDEDHRKFIENADDSLTSKKLGFGRKLMAVRRYNNQFPVDVALTKIAHTEEHYYMAVIRDLTEIDMVENELRSVNERLLSTIDTLKHQSRETLLLNEYTEMLQTCDSFKDYPPIVKSYCDSLFDAVDCKIYVVDSENKLVSMAAHENNTLSFQDCWALKSNKPYPLNSRQSQIHCKHIESDQHTICLPLSAKGSFLGLITVYFSDNSPLIEENIKSFDKILQAFAVRTSICLAGLKLLKEKELQSFKDELTGLYNRRYMNESLSRYLPRAKRENVAVTVLMIDVDHFKQFNDNYGHNLGDTVLIQVAHCIEQCMRETDLVCRFGGEEFVAVMYDATEEDGIVKANNIHSVVQTLNNLPLPITVSIGVAERGLNDDAETLLQHADKALYYAKENGRNQTQSYTPQQANPLNKGKPEDWAGL